MANACARIHCGKCKKKWYVLWRDVKSDYANICPYCGEEIDRDLWEKDIVHALACVEDANMELEKDATGYNKTRFTIDFFAE